MRIGKKSVYQGNTSETSYVVSGTQILSETKGSSTNYYIYDDKGLPLGLVYNGTTYTYRKNLQGDIIAILDSSGAEVVTYVYDAWGNVTVGGSLASTLGAKNPFRYRGYYYDTETGYYYLNSRYYDPITGRFLNADTTSVLTATPTALTDKNLYAYCDNNPVMRVDVGGQFWDIVVDVASLFVSIVDVVCNPTKVESWVSVGADLVCTVVPFATGGGALVKVVTKADDVIDACKVVDTADDVVDVATTLNKVDDVVDNSSQILKPKITSTIENDVVDLPRTGSALQTDPHHAFPDIVDNYAGYANKTPIHNGTLYQLDGSLNGTQGRFEWIVQNRFVTHRFFVVNGTINGVPIKP